MESDRFAEERRVTTARLIQVDEASTQRDIELNRSIANLQYAMFGLSILVLFLLIVVIVETA